MADRYLNFSELRESEEEGVDYAVETNLHEDARFAIVAPHGGGIELGTSEIARMIAGDDHSYAIFSGTKENGNSDLHITSIRFDEPKCMDVVRCSETVIAIHGERGEDEVTYIGGRNAALIKAVRIELGCCDLEVSTHPNMNLAGTSKDNICNRGMLGSGVQLELSRGLRAKFFESLSSDGRKSLRPLLSNFASAVRNEAT